MILLPDSDFCKISAALTTNDLKRMVFNSLNQLKHSKNQLKQLEGGLWNPSSLYTLARYGHTMASKLEKYESEFYEYLNTLSPNKPPDFIYDTNIHMSHRAYLIKQNQYYLKVWP